MRNSTCHWIFNVYIFFFFLSPVDDRVISDHAFIHSVKCNFVIARDSENSAIDTEFASVDCLPVYNGCIFIISNGYSFAVSVNEKIVLYGINDGFVIAENLYIFCAFIQCSPFCDFPVRTGFFKPEILPFSGKTSFIFSCKLYLRKLFDFFFF